MLQNTPDSLLPNLPDESGVKPAAPGTLMVTRVPVFEGKARVWGYDLLLDDSDGGSPGQSISPDDPPAQAAALSAAFALVMPFLAKDEKLNLPMTEALILNNAAYMFPATACCLILSGPITDAAALNAALTKLKNDSYLTAAPCSRHQPDMAQCLSQAGIARLNIREFAPDELKLTGKWLADRGLDVLVENVKPEEVDLCLELGFKYLEGDIHKHGSVVTGKSLSSSQIVKTRLLKVLSDPEWETADVAALIRADVSLAYRLLRYLNSAHFSLPGAITSIESSVVLLGRIGLEQWIYVTVCADMGAGPLAKHIVNTAAFRGKFLELLAGESNQETPPKETLFMLGLFSMLEALLNAPLQDIAAEIKIDEEITRTLQGEDTQYQPWFSLLLDYEHGRWDSIRAEAASLGLSPRDVSSAYTRAMTWMSGVFE